MRDKKKTIVIGESSFKELMIKQKELYNTLVKKHINVKEYRQRLVTDKAIIKFILIEKYYKFNKNIYGIRANGCYGFNEEVSNYITGENNICKGKDILEFVM